MPSVCLYFQVHQPYRLRRYTVFDALSPRPGGEYFDHLANRQVCLKVANNCYRPANRLMLELVRRYGGAFRLTYAISGVALEQLAVVCPDVVESFAALAASGCVEVLGETYHHSLAALTSPAEFAAQVQLHRQRVAGWLGVTPRAFRNTELIYDDGIAAQVAAQGFAVVLTEGVERVLGGQSPNQLYHPPHSQGMTVLLKNHGLSDDIAFRFSDPRWANWPLTPAKFAASLGTQAAGPVINLFMDYETIGEHQWAKTGIFEFFEGLPAAVLAQAGTNFVTVSEAAARYRPVAPLAVPHPISWADSERDVSAWTGNALQTNALSSHAELEAPVKAAATTTPDFLEDWRRLGTSDHFYYMSTKSLSDGEVHAYFSPYPSPYDAYINYMNVLEGFRRRLRSAPGW